MAPYVTVMDGMSRKEKLSVVAYLIGTLQNSEAEKTLNSKRPIKRQSEFTEADRAYLKEKIKSLKTSPRLARLTELQQEAAAHIDTSDERIRYILGLEQ
mgnify:CR=1 FL=1